MNRTSLQWRRRASVTGLVLLLSLSASHVRAEPFRLRGDVFGQAQAPTGLVSLSADAEPTRWAEAEALIWTGANELGREVDVLVVTLTLTDPETGSRARLGRMTMAVGSLRPVHLDGLSGHLRLPTGTTVDVFGGLPVRPRFADREADWLAGARLGQAWARWGQVGIAFLHRRDRGRLSDQEVGADVSVVLFDGVHASGRATYDLVSPGISEALAFLTVEASRTLRLDLRGTHRSPSRILPATSLFSVLGDVPSQYLGGRIRWRAAPRLDLIAEGGARAFDSVVAEDLRVRGVLRLDAVGDSSIALEATRRGADAQQGWTGARGIVRWAIDPAWHVGLELELVRPDQPTARSVEASLFAPEGTPSTRTTPRGEWWPWGLIALSWRPDTEWVVAAAAEASITAEQAAAFDVLFRAAYQWSGP